MNGNCKVLEKVIKIMYRLQQRSPLENDKCFTSSDYDDIPAPFLYRTGEIGAETCLYCFCEPPVRLIASPIPIRRQYILQCSVCGVLDLRFPSAKHLCFSHSQSFTLAGRGVQVAETEENRFEEVDLYGFNTPPLSRTTTKGVNGESCAA